MDVTRMDSLIIIIKINFKSLLISLKGTWFSFFFFFLPSSEYCFRYSLFVNFCKFLYSVLVLIFLIFFIGLSDYFIVFLTCFYLGINVSVAFFWEVVQYI